MRAALEQVGLDHVDGFYAGSAERIQRALHPHLQKVTVARLENGREIFACSMTDALVEYSRSGQATKPEDQRHVKARIDDVFGNAASLRIDSADFVDFAHVARLNGEWKIVNVVWVARSKQDLRGCA